jgi:hypothetical protein
VQFLIGFNWIAPASCAVRKGPPQDMGQVIDPGEPGQFLVASGSRRAVQPLEIVPDIHLQIANLINAPAAEIAQLAQTVGFLTQADAVAEPVKDWRSLAQWIISLPSKQLRYPGNLDFGITREGLLELRPLSLTDAVLFQASLLVGSGGELFTCGECNRWSDRGGTSPRRADAAFCSDACRIKNKNRRNASRRRVKRIVRKRPLVVAKTG